MLEPEAATSAPHEHRDLERHGARPVAQHCVIVGAQQAGTAAIHSSLASHPAYEQLIADPDAAAVQLGKFLDLDPMPLLGGLLSENRAVGPRAAAIQRARARPLGKAARALRGLLPPTLRRAVKGAVIRGDSKPPIDSETVDLLADDYRGPNAALAELPGRELPW